MTKLYLIVLLSVLGLASYSQSNTKYVIHNEKQIRLKVADSITGISFERAGVSGIFEAQSGAAGNTYNIPTESGKYRVIYHADCGDIVSDTIEVLVYDTITEIQGRSDITLADLHTSGVSIEEAKVLGYNLESLITAGYDYIELAKSGYMLGDFKNAGVTDQVLTTNGIIGEITDTDGNVYPWVRVGEQIWMRKNLAFTCVSGGDCRSKDCESTQIEYVAETGQYYYDVIVDPFSGGTKFDVDCGISTCPTGWHVPTVDEWKELFLEVGYGDNVATMSYVSTSCKENCTSYNTKSRPLFKGGASGLDFDYSHKTAKSGGRLASEYNILLYQTSTYEAPAWEMLIVSFQETSESTEFVLQSFNPLVRCIKNK